MLEKEYKFYETNKDSLLTKYNSRFLLIKEDNIIGDYNSESEAYLDAKDKGFVLGTFLIQECSPDSVLKKTFFSRVIFNQ